jgi:protein O-mannosyl-transferase
MTLAFDSRRFRRLAPWLVALAAMLVYANALRNGFALDDRVVVQQNPNVHHLASFGDAWVSAYWPNMPYQVGLYRPLTIVSYMIEWALWHGQAMGFHLVNVVLHGAVSALVVVLMLQLGAPSLAAAVGGLSFALHPVHVEAVAGVVGYAELMMTLLVLVACLVHRSRAGPVVARWGAIAGCFLAALLVKETAVALPLLLIIVDYLNPDRREPLWRTVWNDAPMYLLLAAVFGGYVGLRLAVLGVVAGTTPAPALVGKSSAVRVATAFRTWLDYIRLIVWPRDLVAEYGPDVRVAASWRDATVYLGIAAGGAIIGAAVWLRNRSPWFTAGVAWFAASVFVVSNLVLRVGIVLAERTLYLPSVGVAFAAVPLTALGRRRPRAAVVAGAVVAVLAVARVWTRTPVWRSTDTLLTQLAQAHPESFEAQSYLGDSAMRAGHPQAAVVHYGRAWNMVQDKFIGGSYARALVAVKNWPEAERVARASCEVLNPGPCLLLVDALLGEGKPAEAGAVVDSIGRFIPPSPELAARQEAVARALADTARRP